MSYERRYSERYPLPDAKITYKLGTGDSDETPVKDITHGGVCFEFSHSAEVGHQLEIEFEIPGKAKFVLKGNIVWTSAGSEDDPGFAAAQFLPYGTDERYNSMKNRDRLRNIIKECIDKNPPNIKFRL